MNAPAYIAHHTPGRVRIEIPARRGDNAFFAALSKQLAQSEQVLDARVNAAAASLVLQYAGQLDDVLDEFRQTALGLPEAAPQRRAAPASWAIDPMLLAGVTFGLVGILQTLRGEIMLPAMSAFWYAAGALRLAQMPAPSATEAEVQATT